MADQNWFGLDKKKIDSVMDDNAVRNEKKIGSREEMWGWGRKMKKKNEKSGNSAKLSSKVSPTFVTKCHQLFEGGVEVDVKVDAKLMSKLMSF